MPNDYIGFANLRSSIARMGLYIPPTVVDPQFKGILVIELINASHSQIALGPGTAFLHLVLARAEGAIPYQGFYQVQRGIILKPP